MFRPVATMRAGVTLATRAVVSPSPLGRQLPINVEDPAFMDSQAAGGAGALPSKMPDVDLLRIGVPGTARISATALLGPAPRGD